MSAIVTFLPRRQSLLDRIFSVFATVREGEGLTAFLLMLNVFILLTAYYIIKPVREALILSGFGAEIKSYAGAGQALLFLLIVPLYGAVASRVNRLRLINGVIGFFISNLVIFYMLGRMQVSVGIIFFLWVGLFNLIVVAQFWAFTNDVYTQEQGRRLFAIVGIGSSLGAIFGAQVAGWLFKPVGAGGMMLITAGLLAVSMGLTNWVHHRDGFRNEARARVAEQPIGKAGGFKLVLSERYLLLIAAMVLLSNFAKTTGEFILGKAVAEQAAAMAATPGAENAQAYIGQFYANFYFWVNVLSAGLQMFLVSRIMKYIGIGAALFFMPLIALGGYAAMAFVPLLGIIRFAKIAENSTEYSIQNTARQALFLRTSRQAKYKAKFAIDSFFARAGDATSALLVFVGTQYAFNLRSFALVTASSVVIWLVLATAIVRVRQHRKATETKQAA